MPNVMRNVTILLAAALLPATAAEAADCAALKIVDRIQMERLGTRDVMPVIINGQQEKFLFDTAG